MKRVFYVSLFLSLFFISCNNDDDSSTEDQEVVENFYALKIGNNWKYEYFRRDGQTDEFVTTGVIEEVVITETALIDEETYFVFQSTTTGNENNYPPCAPENGITTKSKRDSLGYLIENDHHIIFSNENTEDYLLSDNDWGDIYGFLAESQQEIGVPAGTFNCFENEVYAILENTGEMSPGRDKTYFSDEIGEVYREYSGVSNPIHTWEKRLIEFEIID